MRIDRKAMRGLALIAVALFFGIQASRLQLGTLARAGAGLFPLLVSVAVGLIGLAMLIQARFEAPETMSFDFKNIALILAALIGFVPIAQHVNVVVAIVYLVFVSGLAATERSIVRNLQIGAVLIAIAAAFRYLLGLNLPLI